MDLQGLNIFIQVAELNNFTKAGERLGYSQPTVSFQIKQLEAELGVKLFDRIGHTVSLTDEGRAALVYAQRICNMSDEMIAGAGKQYEVEGVVRLGMADSLCTPLIAKRFDEFRKQFPNVSLHVKTGETNELFSLLDHNEVDIVCTLDSPIYNTNYKTVGDETVDVNLVVSKDNPLANKKVITIEEFMEQPFFSTEQGISYNRILSEELEKKGLEIHPVLEMGSADLLCKLVENNLGVAYLPDYVTDASVERGEIVRLQVENLHISVQKQILYRRDKWVNIQMKAFMEYVKVKAAGGISSVADAATPTRI